MMVLGVLGIAILVPAPPAWRIGLAILAIAAMATLLPALVRRVHVRARWARARAHGAASARRVRLWNLTAKVAAAFRAARGGWPAWGFAISNWVLKLSIVGVLLTMLANIPAGAGFCGALGGELAGVLPIQAPAGVGTYEAGVALGTQARHAKIAAAAASEPPAEQARLANADNGRLIFGAALAVHALMLVVALVTALAFSLIVRSLPAPESKT
jgi:hypothetical protein